MSSLPAPAGGSATDVFERVQIGVLGIALCGALAVVDAAVAILARLPALGALTLVFAGSAALLASLTIRVDTFGVEWFFTGRLFSKRLRFDEIESCAPSRSVPMSLGYRIGFQTRCWLVGGHKAVELRSTGMTYVVGADDPEGICAEIARRSAASTHADR